MTSALKIPEVVHPEVSDFSEMLCSRASGGQSDDGSPFPQSENIASGGEDKAPENAPERAEPAEAPVRAEPAEAPLRAEPGGCDKSPGAEDKALENAPERAEPAEAPVRTEPEGCDKSLPPVPTTSTRRRQPRGPRGPRKSPACQRCHSNKIRCVMLPDDKSCVAYAAEHRTMRDKSSDGGCRMGGSRVCVWGVRGGEGGTRWGLLGWRSVTATLKTFVSCHNDADALSMMSPICATKQGDTTHQLMLPVMCHSLRRCRNKGCECIPRIIHAMPKSTSEMTWPESMLKDAHSLGLVSSGTISSQLSMPENILAGQTTAAVSPVFPNYAKLAVNSTSVLSEAHQVAFRQHGVMHHGKPDPNEVRGVVVGVLPASGDAMSGSVSSSPCVVAQPLLTQDILSEMNPPPPYGYAPAGRPSGEHPRCAIPR